MGSPLGIEPTTFGLKAKGSNHYSPSTLTSPEAWVRSQRKRSLIDAQRSPCARVEKCCATKISLFTCKNTFFRQSNCKFDFFSKDYVQWQCFLRHERNIFKFFNFWHLKCFYCRFFDANWKTIDKIVFSHKKNEFPLFISGNRRKNHQKWGPEPKDFATIPVGPETLVPKVL